MREKQAREAEIRAYLAQNANPDIITPLDQRNDDCAFLLRLLDAARAENARLKFGSMEGHEKPCYYCGEPCNDLAGNPGLWSVPGCHADDPGRVKWHHIKCVFPKADRATQAESALAAAREREGVMSTFIGLARLAFSKGDAAHAKELLDECCEKLDAALTPEKS